jgi:hypothetical protein
MLALDIAITRMTNSNIRASNSDREANRLKIHGQARKSRPADARFTEPNKSLAK